jgi:hypothetical protein
MVERIKRTLAANPALEQAATRGRDTLVAGADAAREKGTAAALRALEAATARISPADLQRLLTEAFTGIDPATRAQMADRLRQSGYGGAADATVGAGGRGVDALGLATLAMAAMRGAKGGPVGVAAVLVALAGSRIGANALARKAVAAPGGARLSAADLAAIARSPLARQALAALQRTLVSRSPR